MAMGAVATAAVVALWWVGAVAVAGALAVVLAVAVSVAVAVAVSRVSPPFPCAPASVLLPIPFFKSSS